MTPSARAQTIVEELVTVPESWSRQLPAGTRIHADSWHHVEQLPDDGPEIPSYDPAPDALDAYVGAEGATVELDADVSLVASEVGISIDLALAGVLDAAVDAARAFTLHPAGTGGRAIADLRDALERVGYLASEVRP